MPKNLALLTFALKLIPEQVIHKKRKFGRQNAHKEFSTSGRRGDFVDVVP